MNFLSHSLLLSLFIFLVFPDAIGTEQNIEDPSKNKVLFLVDYKDLEHPFNKAYALIPIPDSIEEFKDLIIKHPEIINMQEIGFKKTLLHHAVRHKNKPIIEFLLTEKADIHIEDELGHSSFRNAFADFLVSKKKTAENKANYNIVDIYAQVITKKTVADILSKKDSYIKTSKKYSCNRTISQELLKFINSKKFTSRTFSIIITTLLCFKRIRKKYKCVLPRPLQNNIISRAIGNRVETSVSEVYRMKLSKPEKKNLTKEDFLTKKPS